MIQSASLIVCWLGADAAAGAQAPLCDMSQYHGNADLSAQSSGQSLRIAWNGDTGNDLSIQFAIRNQVPTIEDLSISRTGGKRSTIVREVTPEFSVVMGLRRISEQQLAPLRALKVPLDQENVSKYRWDAFWDAPLDLSEPSADGGFSSERPPKEGIAAAGQPRLPREPSEISRATASYHATGCRVVSDGQRLTVEFPGVNIGVFAGLLRYTIFQHTNLIREEIVARTTKQWVAYKYDAGLRGLRITEATRVRWRDTSNTWQEDGLSSGLNAGPVSIRAANRLVALHQDGGSIAAFPPPHKFFWARESAVNVGYDWYRKDSADSFSFGIRQGEHEDFSSPEFLGNWALYSARPGTQQLMTVFLYPTLGEATEAIDRALAFTRGDKYKPLAGFQVMNHHYHMEMGSRLLREGGPDPLLPDLAALRALGLNIVSPVDSLLLTAFTASGDPATFSDPEKALKQRAEQNKRDLAVMAMSVAAAKAHSDERFLILPSQEIFNGPLGGHTDLIFSHPVFWDERMPGQPQEEADPKYGKIYHIGGADDLMQMVRQENAIVAMPHPRTKGSTDFPDAIRDRSYFSDARYFGFGARWGMGLDGSETRLCEYRCWPLLDDVSNWLADRDVPLKKVLSISEVQSQSPGDDIYGSSPVTYLRLAKLPAPDDASSVIDALMNSYSFWTTGEVLVPAFELRGTGRNATVVADVEWTLPLEFVEVVWGDGKSTGRQIVSATDLPPFGAHRFQIPFDARGKKWVRFAAWDVAANGAVLQPVSLN
jgi:hypothetical protein